MSRIHAAVVRTTALLLLAISPLTCVCATPASVQKTTRDRARVAAQALDRGWLVSSPTGAQTWTSINAWQRFVIVDALARYTEISGDRTYLPEIERAVANHDGLDGNDDDLWAVIASLHVARLDPSPALLAYSKAKFAEVTSQYWDESCGGGLWWDHQRTYKNAITNELLLYAATALYRATSDPAYAAWAQKEWAWFSRSGMINPGHLVNDGLNAQCKNNGSPTYTYNQGVILGGLAGLYRIDGDRSHLETAAAIAQATIGSLTQAGILHEATPELNQDGQTFKGVFAYYLGDLVPLTSDPKTREEFTRFLTRNADTVWRHRQPRTDKLSAYWEGRPPLYGASAQAAGLALIDATLQDAADRANQALPR